MEGLMLIRSEVTICQRVVNMLQGNLKKFLVCGCLILFSTVVIVVSSLSLGGYSENSAYNNSSALPFFRYINRNIDACHDFYSYCCSRWPESGVAGSDDETRVTQFSILQKKINTDLLNIIGNLTDTGHLPFIVQNALHFYNSCVNRVHANETSLWPLLSFFSTIGGWPILSGSLWSESTFSWAEAVAKILKTFGFHTLIGFYVTVNDKNTSQNLLMLGPPVLDEERRSNEFSVQQVIVEVLNSHDMNYTEFSAYVAEVTKFEKALHVFLKPLDVTKVCAESNKMSIAELQKKIPQLNWVHFIQSVVNISSQDNTFIDKNYELLVYNLDSLRNIVNLLESKAFSQKAIANFIGSVIVEKLFEVIPGVFEKYAYLYHEPQTEVSERLREICFEKMSEKFVLPLDYIYVQNNPDFNRKRSLELIKYLKGAFRNLTSSAKWLDSETELSAFHKLDLMMEIVGYPSVLDNATELDKLFDNFPVMSSNALQNYFQVSEFLVKKEMQKLGSINQREKYLPPRSITDAGAYYDVNWNILVYPLSIHNAPFYYKNGPWYANFGAIGSVISHEITHAFDTLGHERDEFGNCHNWWTNSSLVEYQERAKCFENQFNSYKIRNSLNINGVKTLGENIADSGGLRQAYAAYQQWKADNGEENVLPGLEDYTPEQLFFISYASVWCTKMSSDMELKVFGNSTHSPPTFRVLGSVSNSEDFAKAFNCAKGTPMNPENKCLLW